MGVFTDSAKEGMSKELRLIKKEYQNKGKSVQLTHCAIHAIQGGII